VIIWEVYSIWWRKRIGDFLNSIIMSKIKESASTLLFLQIGISDKNIKFEGVISDYSFAGGSSWKKDIIINRTTKFGVVSSRENFSRIPKTNYL